MTTILFNKKQIFCVLILFLLTFPVFSAQAAVFTVDRVNVDVTSTTAAKARQQALDQGQEEAFKRLLKKLILVQDYALVEDLDVKDPGIYVQSLEINKEKTSNVRYIGNLTVNFNPDAVREFLKFNKLDYAETQSKPLLVIPVYEQRNGGVRLWEEGNLWLSVWRGFERQNSLIPVIVPRGELGDIRTLTLDQALEGNLSALHALARKYGAGGTMVTHATLNQDPVRGMPVVEVAATIYSKQRPEQTFVQVFEGDNPSNVMANAAGTITSALEQRWKLENLIRADQSSELLVRVNITNMKQWVKVRETLDKVGVIRELTVSEFTPDSVLVRISHSGTKRNLISALRQIDLNLVQQGQEWHLKFKTS